MFSDKLSGLLAAIPAAKRIAWIDFLYSPYFNKEAHLIRLYLALEPELKGAAPLEKEKVWQAVFETKAFNDGLLRQYASALTNLAQQFLATEKWQSQTETQLFDAFEALEGVHLKKQRDGVLRKLQDTLDQKPPAAQGIDFNYFRLNELLHKLEEQTQREKLEFQYLEKAAFHLDIAYYAARLRQFCEWPTYAFFKPIENTPQPDAAWLIALQASPVFEAPAVKVWWLILQLVGEDKENAFQDLRLFLQANASAFSPQDLYALYTHLKNYCIYRKINHGHAEWHFTLFELYRELLDNGLLMHTGVLDAQHFKNIVTLGLYTKQTLWVKTFINDNLKHLSQRNPDNIYEYNIAKVYFAEENYPMVISSLHKVEFQDQVTALGARVMLMKTYYELAEWRALDPLLDSFHVYIQRHKNLSVTLKSQYNNLIRFCKRLAHLPPYDKIAKSKLHLEIESCQSLAAKDWFLSKTAK